MDPSKNIVNYKRTILSSQILPISPEYYVFDLQGTAFLWHQVRCMFAILYLIGQKREDPAVIDALLNINEEEKEKGRPNYDYAPEANLVLFDCSFSEDSFEWVASNEEKQKINQVLYDQYLEYSLKAEHVRMLLGEAFETVQTNRSTGKYVNIMKRHRCDTIAERLEKSKKHKK